MAKRAIRIIVGSVAVLLSATTIGGTQPPSLASLKWTVVVDGAEALLPRPRAYRLFTEADEVRLVFTFINETGGTLTIPAKEFRALASIRLKSSSGWTEVGSWDDHIRRTYDPVPRSLGPEEFISLESGIGLTWVAHIRRADGSVLPVGPYEIAIDLTPAFAAIRDDRSAGWRRSSLRTFALTLDVVSPVTAADRAAMHRTAAMAAASTNRHADAVAGFLQA